MAWGPNNPEYEPTALNEDLFGSGLYPNIVSNRNLKEYRIELVDETPAASEFLRAREIPEHGPDLERLRGWICSCRDMHGLVHSKSYFRSSARSMGSDFRVIDVRRQCLAMLGEEGEGYVALSYVWGRTNNIMTKKENVEFFSSEGAFSNVILPKTIRDAISLTNALGHRYLWVDSLCIVQDDDKVKLQLIANMDIVYAESIVTIVAASGDDANTGLSGLHKQSRRTIDTEMVGSDLRLGILPHFSAEYIGSYHATRGWT
jgi:hypothetical protein